MSATPIWLDQNSVGAPDLGGTVGSLYDVFKWGLPQLGWTLEHDDPAKSTAVFRNNPTTGTGYYVRIIDDPAHGPHTIPDVAWFDAFMSAESITPAETPLPISGPGIIKSNAAATTGHDFVLIGCDRFFYILIDVNKQGWKHPAFAGDCVPISPTDSTPFLISSHTGENIEATSTGYNAHNIRFYDVYGTTFSTDRAAAEWMTDMTGAKTATNAYPRCMDVFQFYGVMGEEGITNNPITGERLCTPISATFGTRPRGFFPGIYNVGRVKLDNTDGEDLTALPDGFGGVFDGRVSNFGQQYPRWNQVRVESRAVFMMNRDWYSVL